jgi:hypothetical protein
MKFKLIIASIAVVALAFVSVSFSNIKFVTTDFYYKSNNDYQRTQYGHDVEIDLREQSVEVDGGVTFTDPAKWTTTPVAYTATTDASKYIGKISFNLDAVNPPDGGCDGDLTLQEALDALYLRYVSTGSMPSSLTVCNTVITIEFANAAH